MEEKTKRILITALTFIVGIFLIYFIALQFFEKEAPKEITFGFEEESELVGERIDYLAPDFELLNIELETIKFSDYKDKVIVLFFWNTWNSAAQDQFVIFDAYYQKAINEPDIVFLAVNNQEDKSIASNFIRRGGYILPILLDKDGKIGELYGISVLPAAYFINQKGYVKDVYVGVMNEETIRSKIEDVRISGLQ